MLEVDGSISRLFLFFSLYLLFSVSLPFYGVWLQEIVGLRALVWFGQKGWPALGAWCDRKPSQVLQES